MASSGSVLGPSLGASRAASGAFCGLSYDEQIHVKSIKTRSEIDPKSIKNPPKIDFAALLNHFFEACHLGSVFLMDLLSMFVPSFHPTF